MSSKVTDWIFARYTYVLLLVHHYFRDRCFRQ